MDSGVEVKCGKRMQQILVGEDDTPEGFREQVSKLFGVSEEHIVFYSELNFVLTPAHVLAKSRKMRADAPAGPEDGSPPLFKVYIPGPLLNGGPSHSASSSGKQKLVSKSGSGEHWKKILHNNIPGNMPREPKQGLYLLKSQTLPQRTISGELLVCHLNCCLCHLAVHCCTYPIPVNSG